MGDDFSYDPVTAIDEVNATGRTAELFGDIRETMDIPLVTSIWRGLAGMDDSLDTAWRIAKPVYTSGLPEQALADVVNTTALPIPQPLTPTQLHCAGISRDDLDQIRTIVSAYNRSNGMNMVALAAIVNTPSANPATLRAKPVARRWREFAPLMAQEDIDASTWDMVRQVNVFGSPGIDANVATLWRHLAHWPALLSLVHAGMAPLHTSGAITQATRQVTELARIQGAAMAHLCGPVNDLSPQALRTITGYVTTPTQVVRMVTLGHALARWLA